MSFTFVLPDFSLLATNVFLVKFDTEEKQVSYIKCTVFVIILTEMFFLDS